MKTIQLIELFAGVGSQAMALRDLGLPFKHLAAIEFDKYAMASYNAIHGTTFKPTDIRDVSGSDLNITDKENNTYLLTYSFPCQDLSVAGTQKSYAKGSNTRSALLWEVGRILSELPIEQRPDILLMENVQQVHSSKNIEHWNRWLSDLEDLGYTTTYADLNAMNFGIAQSRKRCFAVSYLNGKQFKFPDGIPLENVMHDYLEDEVDEKYYIDTDKARQLIVKLIENGKLQLPRERERERERVRNTCDMSTLDATCKPYANAIIRHYDKGINTRRSECSGVCEVESVGLY